MNTKRIVLLISMLLLPLRLFALEAPVLSGRVVDGAGMLSSESRQRLEQKLAAFERETSNQVAVLTVSSLQGDDIDQFSTRVADAWKLGQKGKDNGVYLILARDERKVRIEVGMGLQGVLPDVTAGRIIRETMRPFLKSGDFDQGITAGVEAVMAATRGEFKGTGQPVRPHASKKTSPSLGMLLVVAVIVVAVLGLFSRYLGGAAGAVGLPLAASLAFPGVGLIVLLVLAAVGLVAGFLLSMLLSEMSGGGGYYGGGWGGGWGGGFFGGGGGGSSGGSDSFSGGGGESDGGGSSDDY